MGGLSLPAFAQAGLPDPKSVLDRISVDGYVREDYRKLYNMTSDPLWDPAKDWIRTVDWEKVRSEQAGKTVRFRHRRRRPGIRRRRPETL